MIVDVYGKPIQQTGAGFVPTSPVRPKVKVIEATAASTKEPINLVGFSIGRDEEKTD